MFPATCGLFLEHGRIKRWILFFLLAWGLLEMGEIALAHHDKRYKTSSREGVRELTIDSLAPVFTLTDQQERPFNLAELRGKVVLMTFIYTSCVDACPLLTAGFAALQRKLNEKGQRGVFFLSITTDPEIDTPKILKSYAKRYRADLSSWFFLSGKPEDLKRVWRDYGVRVQRRAKGLINHTFLTLLIDQAGVLRRRYFGSLIDVETILNDIIRLKGGKS